MMCKIRQNLMKINGHVLINYFAYLITEKRCGSLCKKDFLNNISFSLFSWNFVYFMEKCKFIASSQLT